MGKSPAMVSGAQAVIKRRPLSGAMVYDVAAIALLVLIAFLLLGTALTFAPTNADDLIILSSVSHTSSPLAYFLGDWGLGNAAYRPLHSTLIWLSFRTFGVNTLPDQALNIVLHVAN